MEPVVNLQTEALERIGRRIDAAWKRVQASGTDWIEGSLELMQALGEARAKHSSDQAFGAWLKENEHDHVNKNDRAALVGMSSDLTVARDVLTNIDSRSFELIWKQAKDRFPNVRKPRRKKAGVKRKPKVSNEQKAAAAQKAREGMTQQQAAEASGIGSVQQIKTGEQYLQGWEACMQSLLDAAAQKNFTEKGAVRIDEAIRIHRAKLTASMRQEINQEVIRRIAEADDAARTHNKELMSENLRLSEMVNERAVFTEKQYGWLLMCVHPDNTASVEIRNEMLSLLVANKRRLVKRDS